MPDMVPKLALITVKETHYNVADVLCHLSLTITITYRLE